MKNEKLWVNFSIIDLGTVAFLGFILRSKIVYNLPFIDYNRLLDAHEHFAFGGWVTLALLYLMIRELLPVPIREKRIYHWILGCIVLTSWGMLFTYPFGTLFYLSNFFSTFFILTTYIFGWAFIRDILKSPVSKSIRLLAISSVICLILSSLTLFEIAYLFSISSLDALLYRDALFSYLHLTYNGFFTLAVFALLFNRVESKASDKAKHHIYRFALLLCGSIIPSLFISYLWQNPNVFIRVVAIAGSLLLLLSFIWLIISALALRDVYRKINLTIRILGVLSLSAFMLKEFLQSFTIFPVIGDAVFGDRPVIIGFLHLVFLAFISLFIITYYAQIHLLSLKNKFTEAAIIVFVIGVAMNEAILMLQGLGAMFISSSNIYPILLWIVSIWLFTGALMITIARFKYLKTNG